MYSVNRIHNAVKVALRKGLLVKGRCEICGSQKVEGHHDNYNRPLTVTWLCVPHHKDWHRVHKPIQLVPDSYVLSTNEYIEMGLMSMSPISPIRSLTPPKPQREPRQ